MANHVKPIYVLIVLMTVGLHVSLMAQVTLGARELSLGQAVTALPESSWSVFGNPAMPGPEQASVSFYGVRYYGLDELTDMAAAAMLPTGIGNIGVGAHRFGNDIYNESRLRAAYQNDYQGFYFGVAASYYHVSFGGNYGTLGAIGIDAGLGANLMEGLWFGAKAGNINRPSYGEYGTGSEELARDLSLGLSYRLSEIALFSTDVVKDIRFPVSFRGGIEFSIWGNLKGRAGVTTQPVTFTGGFGYGVKHWAFNIAVQQHENPVLGLSPGVDLNLSW